MIFSLALVGIWMSQALSAEQHHVTIREVSGTDGEFAPDLLHVHFQLHRKDVILRLKRNVVLDVNAPVTFSGDGQRRVTPSLGNVVLYHDIDNFASISATSRKNGNRFERLLHGSFKFGLGYFVVEPSNQSGHVVSKREIIQLENTAETVLRANEIPLDVIPAPPKPLSRKKRSTTSTDYATEILFVIDFRLWSEFMDRNSNDTEDALVDLKFHFSHIINGMQLVFSTIQTSTDGFSMTLLHGGYYIAESSSDSTWVNGDSINGTSGNKNILLGSKVLEKMATWSLQDGRKWDSPDHSMLWTGDDLYGSSLSTIGYSPLGGICLGRAVSVCEYHDFHAWQVAAHELAHNLGAYHDTTGNCPDSGNVMEPSVGQLNDDQAAVDFYLFSSCSKNAMKNLLAGETDGFPRFCLMENNCSHAESINTNVLPGEKYNLTEQCRMRTEYPASVPCNANSAEVCREVHCAHLLWSNGQCRTYWIRHPGAADGTPCGTGKLCYQAQCVNESAVPTSTASCTPSSLNTTVDDGVMDHSWYKFHINIPNPDGSVTLREIPCSDMLEDMYPKFCYQYAEVARYCPVTCQSAGIHYPDDYMAGCYQIQGYVSYNGQVQTCDGFAQLGWCSDPVISYNCCQSCLAVP